MNDALVIRAARAVVDATDSEGALYDAQSPVSDWALDALGYALDGDDTKATLLLDTYERAPWDEYDADDGPFAGAYDREVRDALLATT